MMSHTPGLLPVAELNSSLRIKQDPKLLSQSQILGPATGLGMRWSQAPKRGLGMLQSQRSRIGTD